MIRGVDIDGVLTTSAGPGIRLPWWLCICLAFAKPNKKTLEAVKRWNDNGDKVMLISARPKKLESLTKRWLDKHKVSYRQLFLVGQEKGIECRKLEIAVKEGITLVVDDNRRIVDFLREKNLQAFLPEELLRA